MCCSNKRSQRRNAALAAAATAALAGRQQQHLSTSVPGQDTTSYDYFSYGQAGDAYSGRRRCGGGGQQRHRGHCDRSSGGYHAYAPGQTLGGGGGRPAESGLVASIVRMLVERYERKQEEREQQQQQQQRGLEQHQKGVMDVWESRGELSTQHQHQHQYIHVEERGMDGPPSYEVAVGK